MIDNSTGSLILSNDFTITKQTKQVELVDYLGKENLQISGPSADWINYTIRNIQVRNTYFILTFYYEKDDLKMIHFVLDEKPIPAGSWDDWSLNKEQEKQAYYDTWLTQQIGKYRVFSWGSVSSVFDERGGSSFIFLKYT